MEFDKPRLDSFDDRSLENAVAKSESTLWVACRACGGDPRKHRVLLERIEVHGERYPEERFAHRFVQCMGCEGYKYVLSWQDLEVEDAEERIQAIYPDAPDAQRRRENRLSDDSNLLPTSVLKMYCETITATNAGALTLAAGGLRAVVEAICIEHKVKASSLQGKIDKLVDEGLLTKPQAELLHEERFLGNAALHELSTPRMDEVEVGLTIVEGLINTIYILPSKAKRLKSRRDAKSLKSAASRKSGGSSEPE